MGVDRPVVKRHGRQDGKRLVRPPRPIVETPSLPCVGDGRIHRRRRAPGEPTRCSMDRSTSEALRPAPGPLSHREIRAIIGGIIVAMLLAALDQTIVATALPTIGRELGDVEDMPWVVTAYLLASTAVTPLYGKFSDIHGRRITLLIGIVDLHRRLARLRARADHVPPDRGPARAGPRRRRADLARADDHRRRRGAEGARPLPGLYRRASSCRRASLGPVLGGFFAEHLHWSVIFWINLPLGALAFWMSNAALQPPAAPRPPPPARPARRRAPHGRDHRPSARAQLGRRALPLALGADRRPPRRDRRRCGPPSPCACTPRASR